MPDRNAPDTKPGYQTTEFALAILVVLPAVFAAMLGIWRGTMGALEAVGLVGAASVAAAGYAASRARVKADKIGQGDRPK